MRKILLILMLLGCSFVFAAPPKDKVIYCPDKITCTNKGCSFSSEDSKYFGKISIVTNDGSPLLASYPYQSTTANFHSHETAARCNYGNLQLEIKNTSNLEAYRIAGSSWNGQNPTETCYGKCPLHESRGFVITNSVKSGEIYASVAQQNISKLNTKNSHIIFDDILLQCGGLKECVIDIQSSQYETYGYVVVDMDTMDILQVNSLDPIIKINKIKELNAIEINRIDEEREDEAIYCPPVLKCNTVSGTICTFASIDVKYFGRITDFRGGTSTDQLFTFHDASVDAYNLKESRCNYRSTGNAEVTLLTNPEYHLENYSGKTGFGWKLQGNSYICVSTSTSTNDCPFNKRFDVVIRNVNVGNGVYASIPTAYISQLFFNNASLSIARHDTMSGCDGAKECTIKLLSSQQAEYGSVTIDMKTMNILRVNSLYPNYIKISKVPNKVSYIVEISYATDLKLIPQILR